MFVRVRDTYMKNTENSVNGRTVRYEQADIRGKEISLL